MSSNDTADPAHVENEEVSGFSELIGSLDTSFGGTVFSSSSRPAHTDSPCSILRLNSELYIAAQIDEKCIKEMQAFGIRSVFNLRQPDEEGNADFAPQLKELNIALTNYPILFDTSTWTEGLLDQLLTAVDAAQPPTLIYCTFGMRAGMIGMAHMATRSRFNQGKLHGEGDPDAFFSAHASILEKFKGNADGLSMQEYVKTYVAGKVKNMITRPGMTQLREDIFVSGQLTEDEIAGLSGKGIKAVINMRPLGESGQFGAGVLPREEQLVQGQGLAYAHFPVPVSARPFNDPAMLQALSDQLAPLPRPLLVHCRSGGRAKALLKNANIVP